LSLAIELLSKQHDRMGFDCGDNELNQFLQRTARQHINKGISRTFVLVDGEQADKIIAYMTLVVCEVLSSEIPSRWQKKYPARIPAAKLARLAVSKSRQRSGYGAVLLVDAIKKTVSAAEHVGIAGLFVDAKHEQAKAYYSQFGFLSLPDQLCNLFLPLATLKKM